MLKQGPFEDVFAIGKWDLSSYVVLLEDVLHKTPANDNINEYHCPLPLLNPDNHAGATSAISKPQART